MPSPVFCKVSPAHEGTVRALGAVFLVALVVALLTRKAYYRRLVVREDEPMTYWSTVLSYAVIGMLCFAGSSVCSTA